MGVIIVDKLEVFACHGVNPEEKIQPQPFAFSAALTVDFGAAVRSDDVADTVSYAAVCKLLTAVTQENCFNLIEKLAAACAFAVMENFPAVQELTLTVEKPRAPMKHKFASVGVTVRLARTRVLLSLGSSLGDRAGTLDGAVKLLSETRGISLKKVSTYIETLPYGGVAKQKFLNGAAEVQTFLPPHALLDEIHRIEGAYGRVRNTRWEDRTLDIDIVFYGNEIIADERLTVPHPEYARRDFVLTPLKEIAGDFVCPILKKRVKDI